LPKIWLSENLPLAIQGCDSSTTLYLAHKYWFHDMEELADPESINSIYTEVNERLLTKEFDCEEDTQIQLAACRAQVLYGNYDKGKPLSAEQISSIVPSHVLGLHTTESWERIIAIFYEHLKDLKKEEAQKKLLGITKDRIPNIQIAYFPAQYSSRDMQGKINLVVGVDPEGIGLYLHKNNQKKLQVFYRFHDLTYWQSTSIWGGQEAPDYKKPQSLDKAFETTPLVLGPFRTHLNLKTRSKRARDVEVEVSSFIPDDDSIINFLNTYASRFQAYLAVISLDDATNENSLQIRTLTGISKKIRTNSEMSGQELFNIFAEKIGLQDTSFFQLAVVSEDGPDQWIDFKDPIVSEGLSTSTPVTLKVRYFSKHPSELVDPVVKTLYFEQIHQSIVKGEFPMPENLLLELTGIHLQYKHGNLDKKSEIVPSKYIPRYLFSKNSNSSWQKKITSAYEKLKDVPKEDALNRYLFTASNLPHFGLRFYEGILPKGAEECLIGVGKEGIFIFKPEDRVLLHSFRFGDELRSYKNDGESIILQVKVKSVDEKPFTIVALQFVDIIDTLDYYERLREL